MRRHSHLLRTGFIVLAGLAMWAAPVHGQFPMPPASPPPLFVRWVGPPGMQITFYRGNQKATTLTAPCVVGLRPGYGYQVKLSGIPGHPLPLYPTLEVRGSLVSPDNKVKPRDFPAALSFTEQELADVAAGAFLTKIVVLEKVETAIPEAATVNNPLMSEAAPGEDPMRVASDLGTPMLIVRLGQREISEEEALAHGLFGTIQLPGEKALPQPPLPPYLPWACPALFDPLLGPKCAGADLCLPDGGAVGNGVGFDIEGKLAGLEASDTVAEYVDSKGIHKIAVSNRVCVCVPRFVVVRGELRLADQLVVMGPNVMKNVQSGVLVNNITPVLIEHQNVMLGVLANHLALSSTLAALGTVAYGQVEGVEMYVNIKGLRGVSSLCKGVEEAELPEGPLCLIKWPDQYCAMLGDTITFTLKYTNQGGKAIHQVVVSDSLLSRYEYVPGSQQTDRPATFTTQPNEAGSLILRWEINEDLPPGQSGVIRFQVKIR
jgi:uncharacterized repeat protein (TIGR01451 family)